MTGRLMFVALLTTGLAGCETTDSRMGLATAYDTAAEQPAAQPPAMPIEGGSAVRGVNSIQRYLTGTVRQPAGSVAEAPTTPGDNGVSPSPR